MKTMTFIAIVITTVLCLAPAVLLVSELDNFAADWSDTPSAVEISAEEPIRVTL